MSGKRGADGFWGALAARLLHPVQLHIVEAMRWIGLPLSTSQLFHIFDEEQRLSTVAYHVRRLAALGVLKRVQRRKVRGTVETLYGLAFPSAPSG